MHYGPELTHGARVDDGWTYRGLRTVVLENEVLRAVILADKGADISSLVHKPSDTEFLWRSPWGVRDPRRYVPTDGDGLGVWIDHYEGGWQTVLPAGGGPVSYQGASFGIHGEANLMPWDHQILEEGPHAASVRFRVKLARSPFEVTREVSLEAGRPTLTVRQSVSNVGADPFDIVWGEHIALGAPFLADGCILDHPGGTVHVHASDMGPTSRLEPGSATPWPHAAAKDGGKVDLRHMPGADADLFDQAYIGDLAGGWYAVTNPDRNLGFAVRFPEDVFRYLWYWQVFGGGHGYPWWGRTYNVGLEPFTSYPNDGLEEAVRNGSALRVGAGETIDAELHVTAFASRAGVISVDDDGSVQTKKE